MSSSKEQYQTGSPGHADSAKHRLSVVRGFADLIGQAECIRRIKTFGDLYASKGEVPEHILLIGADGMRKSTIGRAFAKSYNTGLRESAARKFTKLFDLSADLTSLDPNDAFLISDIQDLRKNMKDMLCLALRDLRIDLKIGVGPVARIHPYQLNRFTLISTAPRLSDVPPDLLKCFSLSISLQPYSTLELESIARGLAKDHGLNISEGVARLVASVAQGNPGTLDQLMLRLSKLGKTDVTETIATQVLSAFGLNPRSATSSGLSPTDDLDKLTGIEFEKLITALFQRMGFTAEMTRVTGDGGIDIVAHLEKPFVGGRYLIQCKRFAPDILVGAPVVREFYGACVADQKAIKGILITTSAFTAQAQEFAQSLPIELIDRTRLNQLLSEIPSE